MHAVKRGHDWLGQALNAFLGFAASVVRRGSLDRCCVSEESPAIGDLPRGGSRERWYRENSRAILARDSICVVAVTAFLFGAMDKICHSRTLGQLEPFSA